MEFHLLQSFQEFSFDLILLYFFVSPYFWTKSGEIITGWGYDGSSEVYRTIFCFTVMTLYNAIESLPKTIYEKFVIDE